MKAIAGAALAATSKPSVTAKGAPSLEVGMLFVTIS